MKLMCESFVNNLLPAVRALIARDLLEKHGLTQREAARRLEMTQPAISQYKNKLRGRKAKKLGSSKSISNRIKEIAEGVAKQQIDRDEYDAKICDICKCAKEESLLPSRGLCQPGEQGHETR